MATPVPTMRWACGPERERERERGSVGGWFCPLCNGVAVQGRVSDRNHNPCIPLKIIIYIFSWLSCALAAFLRCRGGGGGTGRKERAGVGRGGRTRRRQFDVQRSRGAGEECLSVPNPPPCFCFHQSDDFLSWI